MEDARWDSSSTSVRILVQTLVSRDSYAPRRQDRVLGQPRPRKEAPRKIEHWRLKREAISFSFSFRLEAASHLSPGASESEQLRRTIMRGPGAWRTNKSGLDGLGGPMVTCRPSRPMPGSDCHGATEDASPPSHVASHVGQLD